MSRPPMSWIRAHVSDLAAAVQEVTGQSVELAFVDQGYTGDEPTQAAIEHGIYWSMCEASPLFL
jgi:hypothetical protein